MLTASDVVRRFRGKRILVAGDAMLDSYYEGTAARLCTEGPVPVVRRTGEIRQPGGAGNTAVNIAALGAEVRLLGVTGVDVAGQALRVCLRQRNVSDEWLVADDQATTLHKLRILADGQYVVRFDEGDTSRLSDASSARLLQALEDAAEDCDAILISDYTFGALTDAVLERLARIAERQDVPFIVDSKNLSRFARAGATVVTPNHVEAGLLVSRTEPSPDADMGVLGRQVLELVDASYAAVTLGKDGVLLAGRDGSSTHFAAHPVRCANDVGAGDTFAAALTLALASGAGMHEAVRIGIDAASLVVSRPHTAAVDHQELLQRVSLRDFSSGTPTGDHAFVSLLETLERERLQHKRVVFTNGVFDILHAGHVEFLRQAHELGDVLVVAVNSDRSARQLKGRNRPINSERDRLALIAALGPVDHAVLFDDETPTEIIRRIRPDVHVKGGDHAGIELPEAETVRECGGEVVILPLVGDLSTSATIDRILSLAMVPPMEAQVSVD